MAKKILVVDDEKNLVRMVEMNLVQHGYEVIKAYDGRQALKKLDTTEPDLILLDVMMPHVDGFAVLHEIKARPELSHLPVIMLTVRAQEADILHGVEAGAEFYLTKPFSPEELLTFVERFLGGRDEES